MEQELPENVKLASFYEELCSIMEGTMQKETKTAGFMVHYGLDGKAERAETHNEWLANIFRRDGAFMVPNSLSKHALAGFTDELEKIANATQ